MLELCMSSYIFFSFPEAEFVHEYFSFHIQPSVQIFTNTSPRQHAEISQSSSFPIWYQEILLTQPEDGKNPSSGWTVHTIRSYSGEEMRWNNRGQSQQWPRGRSRCCRTWRTASACSPETPAACGGLSGYCAATSCRGKRGVHDLHQVLYHKYFIQ